MLTEGQPSMQLADGATTHGWLTDGYRLAPARLCCSPPPAPLDSTRTALHSHSQPFTLAATALSLVHLSAHLQSLAVTSSIASRPFAPSAMSHKRAA